MGERAYAKVSDITALGKSLTAAQLEAAEILIDTASSKLRIAAAKHGKDIDTMIADEKLGDDYAAAVKNIVIQAVCRAIDGMDGTSSAISQGSQTVGSFSTSMTFVNAGQSLYFLRNELKELGLVRQKFGALDVYGME